MQSLRPAIVRAALAACLFTALTAPVAGSPMLRADLTFDTHMYALHDTVTPYFGAGVSAAIRREARVGGTALVFTEAGIVSGAASNGSGAAFHDVLVPAYASVSLGVDADRRFAGWAALRAGSVVNIVAGWGADFPWSVGVVGGIATRVAGPFMAMFEVSVTAAYPGGIAARLVSSRAGIRYAPVEVGR